jgi:hypothetical protein
VIATFLALEAFTPTQGEPQTYQEQAVFSCNYNGWADVPEEEREGIDAFEAAPVPARAVVKVTPALAQSDPASRALIQRKAA